MAEEDGHDGPSDEPRGSAEFGEVLRCERGEETRIYSLHTVPGGVELWRLTEIPGEEASSVKECLLTTPEETAEFLDEVRRTLRAGGWQQV